MLIPAAAVVLAGILGAQVTLTNWWRSAVQHFAAGVVFAAISTEIVPAVNHAGTPGAAIGGFAAGVGAMFGMRWLADRLESVDKPGCAMPLGFLSAVSVDCVIDGVTIGTGFAAGLRAGVLISAALSLEMFFLGLATADAIKRSGKRTAGVLAACATLALILGASACVGYTVLHEAPTIVITTLLSFGSAALLYLVTEELLVRAHDHGETRVTTSLFFLGFLTVFTADLFT